MLMGLAGLTTLTCLPQSNANTPEKPPAAHPTESESKRFYQLSFVVRELENERLINSRSYLIILRGGGGGQGLIRAGEKVPFASTSGASTQWQQIDVGVGIDCRRLEEVGDRLSLNLTAEISNVTESHEQNGPSYFRAHHSKQPMGVNGDRADKPTNCFVLVGRSGIEAENAIAVDRDAPPLNAFTSNIQAC